RVADAGALLPLGQDVVNVPSAPLAVPQHRAGRWRQSQAPDASILRIDAALDQAQRLEPVNEPCNRNGSDLGDGGEFVLRQVRLALKPDQNDPLRPGQPVRAGQLIGVGAHVAGGGLEEEPGGALGGGGGWAGLWPKNAGGWGTPGGCL